MSKKRLIRAKVHAGHSCELRWLRFRKNRESPSKILNPEIFALSSDGLAWLDWNSGIWSTFMHTTPNKNNREKQSAMLPTVAAIATLHKPLKTQDLPASVSDSIRTNRRHRWHSAHPTTDDSRLIWILVVNNLDRVTHANRLPAKHKAQINDPIKQSNDHFDYVSSQVLPAID